MVLEVTVRGEAESAYPAERAIVSLSASIEGSDKQRTFADAMAVQEPLIAQLRELADREAVTVWSSDQVRVSTHRPWVNGEQRGAPVHTARVDVTAEFIDFERLGGFVEYWSGRDGVEVNGVSWDVLDRNRRAYEADVRKSAVEDAFVKAQAYADAVRRGRVVATRLADPGLLNASDGSGPSPYARTLAATAFAEGGTGPELELTPADIVIRVEVDAQFTAD
jgi:uncharacterized protein YggE